MTGRRAVLSAWAGRVMLRFKHSNSFWARNCFGSSLSTIPSSSLSRLTFLSCGQIGLWGRYEGGEQRAGQGAIYSPVGGCVGAGGIGGKEPRLAEAGRNGSVFNATELLYGKVWRR